MIKALLVIVAIIALSFGTITLIRSGKLEAIPLTRWASSGELTGEVFIVTKGAQNIKLALVKVMAIPEAEINAFLNQKQPSIEMDARQFLNEILTASQSLSI